MQLEINKINYLRDLVQLEPHVSSEKRLHENRRFIQLSWQTQSISLVFPKQPDFQMYLTCSPVSAPRRLAVGSSFFSSLLLICWSFIHSMRCNCCSLVALAFSCSLLCSFGRRESEAKAEAPALSGKQKKQKKNTQGRCGTASLTDQYRRFDVVFESPASPTVLYQLSLTGNMSGPISGERRAEERRKQKEHFERFAGRAEAKKEQDVKTFVFEWWSPEQEGLLLIQQKSM